jgi:hypothetical protein
MQNGNAENKENSAMDVDKSGVPGETAPNGVNNLASDSADAAQAPNSVWPIKDNDGYVVVPFTYGSVALWQGKRAPEFQTFRW